MADLQKLVDDLSTLTVLEAADLAKMLEEKWGVSAAAAVAVAAAPGAAAAAVEENTDFTVVLTAIGEKKIASRNRPPVTIDARPVRPPSPIPDPDSMNVVLDDAEAAPPAAAGNEAEEDRG